MIYYTLILYTTFVLYLIMGIHVYRLNSRSLTNRSFCLMCLQLSIWGLGYALMNSAASAAAANFWRIFSALGWCFFYSSWLYFALMLTNREGIFKKGWFWAALYFPSMIFFLNTTRFPADIFVRNHFGWTYIYSERNFLQIAFNFYYAVFLAAGLLLIFFWGRKSQLLREKKQASVILRTVIITIILGVPTDTILPLLGIQVNPMAIVFLLISAYGMWYAIIRYKMMVLSPEVAADYILKTMLDPVILIGQDLLIKEVNKAALEISGYSSEELLDKSVELLVAENEGETGILPGPPGKAAIQNKEINFISKERRIIPCLFSAVMISDDLGELLGTVCVFHDITDRKQAETQLEDKVRQRTSELERANEELQKEIQDRKNAQKKINFIAYHDVLTGLPNRLLFHERIAQSICQMGGNKNELAVIFLDLDNFKLVNDTLGHPIGDLLLKQVAQRLTTVIRESDTVARIGGDEFLILITNLKEIEGIETVLKRISAAFKEPFRLNGHENFISVSIGVAVYPYDGVDAETLIRSGDIAMYEAKSAGRNTFRLCSPELKNRFIERTKLRNSLYRALERDELSVYYQPQVDSRTGSICGFEALMRWQQNHEHFVSPSDFIPLAEETGLIIPFGEWLIRKACFQINKWHQMGHGNLRIAVNLSENQLKQQDFAVKIREILQQAELDPCFLELEITERIVFGGNEDTVKVLNEIKSSGVSISIDDFGVDYSSFMNIKKLPIDKIKIAMEFVQGVTTNNKDAAIVDSIIALSHEIGLNVIAEGVETAEQLAYIQDRRCNEVQGFYFYKPMPEEQIGAILQEEPPAAVVPA